MDLVFDRIPKRPPEQIERYVKAALVIARRNGVTSIHDISEETHLPVYRKLAAYSAAP